MKKKTTKAVKVTVKKKPTAKGMAKKKMKMQKMGY